MQKNGSDVFDIVFAGDFSLLGGTSSAIATEVAILANAGYSVGLLSLDGSSEPTETTSSVIKTCVDNSSAKWISKSAACNLLTIHNPMVFDATKIRPHNISSRHRIMVAHHVPLNPDKRLNYDPWQIDRLIRERFGGPAIWAPVSRICREQFAEIKFDLPLLSRDWRNIIDVTNWGSPRLGPLRENLVIGRHSRSGPDKWPASKSEVLLCYPPMAPFEVHFLGAGNHLRTLVGGIPNNWKIFDFGEVEPKTFLRAIDFFVYFHHPQTIESFGRAAAEAAASGCVLVLPKYLQRTFQNGAIYCDPPDVANVVRGLHSDRESYARQSKAGYEFVRQNHNPIYMLNLVQDILQGVGLSTDNTGDRSALIRQFRLRAAYHSRREIRRTIKDSLRMAKGMLPPSMRHWIAEYRSNIRTSRSPDRAVLIGAIFPGFAHTKAFSPGARVLWIGCRRYTKGYYRVIEGHGAKCVTIDIDPAVKRWGSRSRHVTGDVLALASIFPSDYFDAVLCNGILGWGVDAPKDQAQALDSIAAVLKPDGLLMLGWNTNRIEDPIASSIVGRQFEPYSLQGFGERQFIEGCTHVFDIFRRMAMTGNIK